MASASSSGLRNDHRHHGIADVPTVCDDATEAFPYLGSVPNLSRGGLVDRYVILDEIGAGGMGTVYAAYDPELDRKVAIKVLRHTVGPVTEATSSRSMTGGGRALREAQALAKLSHPNVLPIYDVGVVDRWVFLATEFVDGTTLQQWLKGDELLSWKRILDVFVQAGRGLAAAHAEGLVHRDFKPANVLIAKSGQVRVMDFGLVRRDTDLPQASQTAVEPSESFSDSNKVLDSDLTQAGAVVGTLAYMAPEQQLGTIVDARADQYSFCVALYEGLYGLLPFRQSAAKLIVAKYNRTLSPLSRSAASRVPRWLRAIVLRGLSPRPDDRWPSMDALLKALTVVPLRRSPKLWWSTTAVLAASVAAGLLQARPVDAGAVCTGSDERVARVWNPARRQAIGMAFHQEAPKPVPGQGAQETARGSERAGDQAARSTEIWNRVSQELDVYAKAWSAQHREACEATRVRKDQSATVMDLRMACLQQRYWEFEALLKLFEDGGAELIDQALVATSDLEPLAQCEDLTALQSGVPPPSTQQLRTAVDRLDRARATAKALTDAGRLQEAMASLEPLTKEAEDLAYPPVLVRLLAQRGAVESKSGQYARAKDTLATAVSMALEHRIFDVAAEAQVDMLYVVGYGLGEPDEALLLAEYAEGTVAAAGRRKDLSGLIRMNQGIAWYRKGEAAKAFEAMSDANKLVADYFGDRHPRIVASLSNLSAISGLLERSEEAISYARRAVEIGETYLPPESQALGYSRLNLGILLADAGEYEAAESNLEHALRMFESSAGPSNPQVANALAAMAHLRQLQGRLDRAQEYVENALSMQREAEVTRSHVYSGTLGILGRIREKQGRLQEALEAYDEAISISEEVAPRSGEHVASLTSRGRTLAQLGRNEEALATLEQALSLADSVQTRGSTLAECQFATAQTLVRLNRDHQRASNLAAQAAAIWEQIETPVAARRLSEAKRWLAKHGENHRRAAPG